MATKSLLSPELLRKLLRYEPETGKLFWRERPIEMFKSGYFSAETNQRKWNTRFAGREAFTADISTGYLCGRIFGRPYRAHRVVWAIVRDEWPTDQLDHIDHERGNNRLGNLRETSSRGNCSNQSRARNNTSGVTGVSWHKQTNKWRASIMVGGRDIRLGYFDNLSSAAAARASAETKHGFHPNHGQSKDA